MEKNSNILHTFQRHQITADFRNYFTVTISRKFATEPPLNTPPHLKRVVYVPEIIVAKEAVALGLFDGDVNCSCPRLVLQEIPDVNGFVCGWWASLVDAEQNLHQQPRRPTPPTHRRQLQPAAVRRRLILTPDPTAGRAGTRIRPRISRLVTLSVVTNAIIIFNYQTVLSHCSG